MIEAASTELKVTPSALLIVRTLIGTKAPTLPLKTTAPVPAVIVTACALSSAPKEIAPPEAFTELKTAAPVKLIGLKKVIE